MPSPKKDKFLEEVLSYIKFPFDKKNIKAELESHISDKIDDYTEQGYDEEIAEDLTIKDMGNPRDIGVELNKQHNPFIGWLWKITNVMVILLMIWNIFLIGVPFLMFTFNDIFNDRTADIPKSNIVYEMEVDETVKLDDTIITFTDVIYEENGDMNIFFEVYNTKLLGQGWSFGNIGNITDNLGNEYWGSTAGSSGGIKAKYRTKVDNFSKEADRLIITYDNFNRKYKVEIPLEVGDSHE